MDLQEHVVARRIGQVLRGMVASLPVQEAWGVQHYYGLGGQTRSPQPVLAARLGVTRQAIHYYRAVALRRRRHPAGGLPGHPASTTAAAMHAGLTTAARLRTFDLAAIQPQLSLRFPSTVAQDLPEHFRTRSWYRYPGWAGLTERDTLTHSSPLYIALHLMDFSPLRAELVQLLGLQVNGPGGIPFDPVSLFLCALLRWETQRG